MTARSTAAGAYKADAIESAPPLKLVRLLYEGALRFLEQAEAARASGDTARFQDRCLRVYGIVAELRLALDPAQAPELAANLQALYLFVETHLTRALQSEAEVPLAPARDVLATLLAGWKGLELQA